MKTINVRAFKVVFPNGNVSFEFKNYDGRGSLGCGSVQSLAKIVKSEIADFFRDNQDDMVQASIDLRPYHDIECPINLVPRRCLPLTDNEVDIFWEQFNA